MSDIKFPVIPKGVTDVTTSEVKYNPSSIYSYLGWKGTKQKGANDAVKNGVPLLIYLDIFKNYFANTQEDNFYIITGNTEASVTIVQVTQIKKTAKVGEDAEIVWQEPMGDTATLEAGPEVKDYANFWKSVKIRFYNPSNGMSKEAYINYLTSNSATKKITTDKTSKVFPSGNSLDGYTTIQGIYVGQFPGNETLYRNSLNSMLTEQKIETLEKIRDEILKTPGNTTLKMTKTSNGDINVLFEEIRLAQTEKLGGLVLKTYD